MIFFTKIISPSGRISPINKTVNNIDSKNDSTNNKDTKLNTVNQLYRYCLQHSDESVLPSKEKIWQIFVHERNSDIRLNKRNVQRLMKLNFSNCNWSLKEGFYSIWAYYPYPEKSKPPALYACELKFSQANKRIMEYFCDKLYPLLDKNEGLAPIFVAGKWEGSKCEITSKKQIYIL